MTNGLLSTSTQAFPPTTPAEDVYKRQGIDGCAVDSDFVVAVRAGAVSGAATGVSAGTWTVVSAPALFVAVSYTHLSSRVSS